MYEQRFMQVMQAETAGQLEHRLAAFAAHHEFPLIEGFVAIDRAGADTEFTSFNNYGADANHAYDVMDPTQSRRDPVMQYCKVNSTPIAWNRATYVEAGQEPWWEAWAEYGAETGLGVAVHLPKGRHFLFCIEREKPLPKRRDQLTRIVSEFQLIAVLASEIAIRTLVKEEVTCNQVTLTQQELRCLQWTASGLTAFAVGDKLNISERTAVKHLHNAMHKLGCNNKHHAAIAAARAGLIHL